jgi:hypothetical protein
MRPDSFSIRLAEPHDAPEVSRLAAELGYPASVETVRLRLPLLEGRDHAIFVADEAGVSLLGWLPVARRITLRRSTTRLRNRSGSITSNS